MVNLDIGNAAVGDMANAVTDYSVGALNTDGIGSQKETWWTNNDWSKWWGYFNELPDLKSAFLMRSIWNVGKGYITDSRTKVILEHIRGWGKDTFYEILYNMDVISAVGGDSYAEIMWNDPDKREFPVNLKPLDPGTMRHVVDGSGMLIRFEQIAKLGEVTKIIKFDPRDIFYLPNNRLADQIHGISDIKVMEKTVLAEGESFTDMKKIMHRQARPLIMFKLKTDNATKIAAFIAKMDDAINKGDNIYIPDDENIVSYDVVQVNVSQLVLEWRNDIRNRFYRGIGLPQVVPGAGGQSTESESKVIYLAFEQIVEKRQRFLEAQIWQQLNLRINLIPPETLAQDLQQDNSKDGSLTATQPSDITAGSGR